MKTHKISIKTHKRNELVDVTSEVQKIVKTSKVKNGYCIVYCPHTTGAVTINENADPSVKTDIINTLNKLIPENANYAHAEGNSDSHVKSSLVGCSELILIENGELVLGTWQGIMFAEFDGPRNRKLFIQIVSDYFFPPQ